MILQSQIPICLGNLVQTGIAVHAEYFIVIPLPIRVMLVKELPFVWLSYPMLLEKLLESSVCIFRAVFVLERVVVVAPRLVRQYIVGLIDVCELALGLYALARVFFGVPLRRQFLVSLFYLSFAGLLC
jgi:hypothetical protein